MKRLMNLYDDSHWEKADEYYKGTLRKVLREGKWTQDSFTKTSGRIYDDTTFTYCY